MGSEVSLLRMTKRNDDIELLFKSNFGRMHRLAMALLHDSNEASDAVHEVFASIIRDATAGVTQGYLLSAVRNRCLNIIRNMETRRRITELYLLPEDNSISDDWPPEEVFIHINSIISSKLTPQCRKVVELRFSSGLKYSGIAEKLGISEVAVYRHLSNAIEIIRKNLPFYE